MAALRLEDLRREVLGRAHDRARALHGVRDALLAQPEVRQLRVPVRVQEHLQPHVRSRKAVAYSSTSQHLSFQYLKHPNFHYVGTFGSLLLKRSTCKMHHEFCCVLEYVSALRLLTRGEEATGSESRGPLGPILSWQTDATDETLSPSPPAARQHVLRLQVAVDDVEGVEVLNGQQDLPPVVRNGMVVAVTLTCMHAIMRNRQIASI